MTVLRKKDFIMNTPDNWKYRQGLVEMFYIKFQQNLCNGHGTR